MINLKNKVLIGISLAMLSVEALAVGTISNVKVFERDSGQELPIYLYQGKHYVVGTPGSEYEIIIENHTSRTILAVASVDGIDVVSGKTASFKQGGYLVSPWASTNIAGWRKNMGETASFYFTSLGDSYASRTGRPNNVGVIGVAIFREKFVPPVIIYKEKTERFDRKQGNINPNTNKSVEPSAPSSMSENNAADSGVNNLSRGPSSSPLGTGHGRREESNAILANFIRESYNPNEVISIYYDSYENLVNKGVIPQYRYRYHNSQPNAFPVDNYGFVPDPR